VVTPKHNSVTYSTVGHTLTMKYWIVPPGFCGYFHCNLKEFVLLETKMTSSGGEERSIISSKN